MIKKIKDLSGYFTISLLLLFFWFLLAPYFDFYNITIGIIFAFGLSYMWQDVIFKPGKKTNFSIMQLLIFAYYLLHLLINIVYANIQVAKIVLNPKLPISPGMLTIRTILEKDLSRVFYSNSITLTPGTVTVDAEDDKLIVHTFTREDAYDVSDWYMERLMKTLEEGRLVKVVVESDREGES